jgi:hypothetical protein
MTQLLLLVLSAKDHFDLLELRIEVVGSTDGWDAVSVEIS